LASSLTALSWQWAQVAPLQACLLCQHLMNRSTVLPGINICDDAAYFQNTIHGILKESFAYTGMPIDCQPADYEIIDGYVGRGYALNQPEELRFIAELAALEGVILDPVYTGKAFRGMVQEIRKGLSQG
jgi:D-cysteine desulfhydrase